MAEKPTLTLKHLYISDIGYTGGCIRTAEDELRQQFVRATANRLSKLMIDPGFSVEAAIGALQKGFRDDLAGIDVAVIPLAEKEAREDERIQAMTPKYDPNDPVGSLKALLKPRSLGKPAEYSLLSRIRWLGGDLKPEDVHYEAPAAFPGQFAKAIDHERNTFQWLEQAHQHPTMKEYIAPLLGILAELLESDGYRFVQGGADKAYALIHPLVQDARYTIPHTEAELLYFLTYLPTGVRFPIQELLLHNAASDFIQERKREAAQQGRGLEMHNTVQRLLRAGVFANSHWERLGMMKGSSEALNIQLTGYQHLFLHEKKVMAALVDESPENAEVLQTLLGFFRDLHERIKAFDKKYGCNALQQTDINHCFQGGLIESCCNGILSEDKWIREWHVPPEKNGWSAAVLEDDPAQRRDQLALVDKHSAYDVPQDGSTVFAEPGAALIELARTSQRVRIFLLDIQNGEDKTAGIDMAEQILMALLERVKTTEPDPETREKNTHYRVVVWSMSPDLLDLAKQRLGSFLQQADPQEKHISINNNSRPIRLTIQMKSGNPMLFLS